MAETFKDVSDVGQDKATHDATEKYDKKCGTYRSTIDTPEVEPRLPTVSMPKGPDPSPFSIGPLTGGER